MCRHRTVTPNPVLVNPESFMEASRSPGALPTHLFHNGFRKPWLDYLLDLKAIFEDKFDIYWSMLVFNLICEDRIVTKMNDGTVQDKRAPNYDISFQEKMHTNSIFTAFETTRFLIQLRG